MPATWGSRLKSDILNDRPALAIVLPRRVGAGDVTASDAPDHTPPMSAAVGRAITQWIRNDDPTGCHDGARPCGRGRDCDPEGFPGRRPDVDPMAVTGTDLGPRYSGSTIRRHCLVWGTSRRPGLWVAEDAAPWRGAGVERWTEGGPAQGWADDLLRLRGPAKRSASSGPSIPGGGRGPSAATMRRHGSPDGRSGPAGRLRPDGRSRDRFPGAGAWRRLACPGHDRAVHPGRRRCLQCKPGGGRAARLRADKRWTERRFSDPHDLVRASWIKVTAAGWWCGGDPHAATVGYSLAPTECAPGPRSGSPGRQRRF